GLQSDCQSDTAENEKRAPEEVTSPRPSFPGEDQIGRKPTRGLDTPCRAPGLVTISNTVLRAAGYHEFTRIVTRDLSFEAVGIYE
ncbi:hypothetical protein BGZ65_001271, partial [Modicella reniformis]